MVKDGNGKEVQGLEQGPFEPIAIIGVSALMPDANPKDVKIIDLPAPVSPEKIVSPL